MILQATTPPPATPTPSPAPAAVAGQAVAATPVSSLQTLDELLGRPATPADVRQIRSRADRLSDQITSAQGRRDEVAQEYAQASDPAIRQGLQNRLKVLDDRLAQLELDIAFNSKLNAAIPPQLLTQASSTSSGRMTESPIAGLSQGGFIAISIVLTIFVLAPIATAFARRIWRKPQAPAHNAQLAATNERMERIEQAIDAVAIEVERISEGQRFVTQLLAKRENQAVGAGDAVGS